MNTQKANTTYRNIDMNIFTLFALVFGGVLAVSQLALVVVNAQAAKEQSIRSVEYKVKSDAKALELCKSGKGSSYIVQGVRCGN